MVEYILRIINLIESMQLYQILCTRKNSHYLSSRDILACPFFSLANWKSHYSCLDDDSFLAQFFSSKQNKEYKKWFRILMYFSELKNIVLLTKCFKLVLYPIIKAYIHLEKLIVLTENWFQRNVFWITILGIISLSSS